MTTTYSLAFNHWICVSGQPPVAAVAVVSAAGIMCKVKGDAREAKALLKLQPFLAPHRRSVLWKTRFHCQKCGHYPLHEQLGDARLGFVAYCQPCVETLADECRMANGRLPGSNEFYCRRCRRIEPLSELVPVGQDGKRRWKCMTCRRTEWNTRRSHG